MTHAWLITGPPGSGRSIAALCFAAALQCTSDGVPGCGECRACTTTMAGTHADVRRIIPEGLSIGVDEMRNIVQIASRRPGTGRWQVVLIEDEKKFSIEVGDEAPHAISAAPASHNGEPPAEDGSAEEEDEMGLAVISGLVDDVEVTAGEVGGLIRMSWPTTPDSLP